MPGLGQVSPWECQIQNAVAIVHIPTDRAQAKPNSNLEHAERPMTILWQNKKGNAAIE